MRQFIRVVSVLSLLMAAETLSITRVQASDIFWSQTVANIKIDDHWSVWGEFQPRWLGGFAHIQTVMARTFVLYQFAPEFRAGAGYMYAPQFLPSARNENRIFEQLDWIPAANGDWRWSGRFRFEQRYLENVPDVALRVRQRGFLAWMPLGKFGAYVWDEIFFGLNHPARNVVPGFDQNRLSFGPRYSLAPVTFEIGYLLQSIRSQPETITANSGVILNLGLAL